MIIMIEFDNEILGLIQAHLIPNWQEIDHLPIECYKWKKIWRKKSLYLLIRQKCLKEYGKHVEVEMRSLWVTICNYWIVMCLICNPQWPHFSPTIWGLQSSHYNPIICGLQWTHYNPIIYGLQSSHYNPIICGLQSSHYNPVIGGLQSCHYNAIIFGLLSSHYNPIIISENSMHSHHKYR